MSWHFLERWLEKANQHSTLIGKFWISFLIVARMVIVATVGDRVYSDEQSEFKCNTLQPGCTNVCFNSFSPISHLRFWSFQILFVATPSVMFVIYSGHKAKVRKAGLRRMRTMTAEEESEKQTSQSKIGQSRSEPEPMKRDIIVTDVPNYGVSKHQKIQRSRSSASTQRPNHEIDRLPSDSPDYFQNSSLVKLENALKYVNQVGDKKLNEFDSNHCNEALSWNRSDFNSGRYLNWRAPYLSRACHKADIYDTMRMEREDNLADIIEWLPYSDAGNMHFQPDHDQPDEKDLCKTPFMNHSNSDNQDLLVNLSAPPQYPGISESETNKAVNLKRKKSYSNNVSQSLSDRAVGHDEIKHRRADKSEKKPKHPDVTEHFRWYIASVFLRLCSEISFTFFQVYLFGWWVPELYKCQRWPCPNVVDCFVSRPTEKTIFLWFMFIYSCICVCLNVIEIFYLTYVCVLKQANDPVCGYSTRKNLESGNKKTHKQPNLVSIHAKHADDGASLSSKHFFNMKNIVHEKKVKKELADTQWFKYDDSRKGKSDEFMDIAVNSDEEKSEDAEIDFAQMEEEEINEMEDYNLDNVDYADLNQAEGNEDPNQDMV